MQLLLLSIAGGIHLALLLLIVGKLDDIRWELKKLNARSAPITRWEGK